LEVEAADAAIDIEDFTSEVEPWADAALHRLQPHLDQWHTASCRLSDSKAAVADHRKRHLVDHSHQPPPRLFGDIASRRAGRLLTKLSGQPLRQVEPQDGEPAAAAGIPKLSIEVFRQNLWQPVDQQPYIGIRMASHQIVPADVEHSWP